MGWVVGGVCVMQRQHIVCIMANEPDSVNPDQLIQIYKNPLSKIKIIIIRNIYSSSPLADECVLLTS